MKLNKICNQCNLDLSSNNATKNGVRNGKIRYRNICKPCHSKKVVVFNTGNDNRKKYIREYIRKIGRVKEYPCENCSKDCYKKYAKAFCSDECRFLSYVEKTDTCWIWTGAKNKQGYGKLSFKGNNSAVSSRVSYQLFVDDLEEGKLVCHTCDNPSCVNPNHLWLGTHSENMIDMVQKDRQYSKIKSIDAFNIRKLHKIGYGLSNLSEKFNITVSAVCNILKNRTWKHI